ncbi:glycosyltransferase family 4 protein [Candidatus Nomurabacteria bacterium]|nr:glycosyltransferase family 4 protein [Candidatus Nomurabacteria bacterium]
MKITIATGIYPPSIGGPATYSKLLFDNLPKQGIDVSVLSYDQVRHLPKGLSHLTFFLKLFSVAKRSKIVFAQDPVSVGLPTLIFCKLTGKKFFIRIAGDYAWEQSVNRFGVKDSIDDFQNKKYGFSIQLLKKIQTFVAKNSDQVITPSKYFRELVIGWGVPESKVRHIYNGIEIHKNDYNKTDSRNALNISSEKKVIISAGRLLPWKGFKELIEVIESLSYEFPDLILYILGDGEQEQELKDLVKEKGLEKSIILTGKVDREIMFKYLSAADLFVLNTSFESFSFQIVEAMQMALPIISTNIGNIPEIVEDGKNGFLIAPNDKIQLKAKISLLLTDYDLALQFGESAHERSLLFSKEKLIENLVKILI